MGCQKVTEHPSLEALGAILCRVSDNDYSARCKKMFTTILRCYLKSLGQVSEADVDTVFPLLQSRHPACVCR